MKTYRVTLQHCVTVITNTHHAEVHRNLHTCHKGFDRTEVLSIGRGPHIFSLLSAASACLWARTALGSTAQSKGLSLEAHVPTGSQELARITALQENWVFNPADLPQSI